METIDIAIVGGGVNGLAAAYRLGERYPEKTIAVFEKNRFVGEEQSGRNSGVDHSRYQHHPESLKSKLRGRSPVSLKEFCAEHDIAYKTIGKLIVATDEKGVSQLDMYQDRATRAGVPIERLSREEVKAKEPNVECQEALYTPTTGLVDAATYVRTLDKLVDKIDGIVLRQATIEDIEPQRGGFVLDVNQEGERYRVRADLVVNAAGLYGDEIARMVNPEFKYKIKPLRGEYMKFSARAREDLAMNGHAVYPVPEIIEGMFDEYEEPKTAGGTHLTPTFDMKADGSVYVGNTILVGPLHQVVEDKSDYNTGRRVAKDFIKDVDYFQLREEDLELDQVGIQVKFEGYDDWVIKRDEKFPNFVHYICDSPGMSGSLDSSWYLVEDVIGDISLEERLAA